MTTPDSSEAIEGGQTLGSLRGRAKRGAVWSLAGFGGGQALRFVANLILTRILAPEAFGLMQLVWVLMNGLNLFSDIGIGPSIIQNRRAHEPGFLRTAFTLQAMRGTALWLIACVVALPYARFYGDGGLAWLVPLVALTALFQGVRSTKMYTASRELVLERVTAIELGSQLAGAVVMIVWALLSGSVMALAMGALVAAVVEIVCGHVFLPGARDQFGWEKESAREMARFGRWIFLSTVLTFFAGQTDRLIFGKLIPLGLLGVFGIAAMLAALPAQALSHLSHSLLFPLFSRVAARGENLGDEVRRAREPVLVVGAWAVCGLAAGGPTIVRLLYDPNYAAAGWIVQWLAVAAWFQLLESLNGAVMLARGKAKWVAASSLSKVVAMVALIPLGYTLAEFPGAVAGAALSEVFRYLVSALAVAREGVSGWRRDLGLTLLLAATAGLVWWGTRQLPSSVPVVAEAVFVAVATTVVWLPFGGRYLPLISRRRQGGR